MDNGARQNCRVPLLVAFCKLRLLDLHLHEERLGVINRRCRRELHVAVLWLRQFDRRLKEVISPLVAIDLEPLRVDRKSVV